MADSLAFRIWSLLTVGNIFLSILFLLLLHYLVEFYQFRGMPPGPRVFSIPFYGGFLMFDPGRGLSLFESTQSLMKYYGRIISLRLGSFRVVIAASPESVKEVLITKSADFAGRPPQASYFYTTVGGNYGPAWRLHRKIFVTALRHYMSSAQLMENCIVQQGESMLQYFDKQSSRAFNPQGVITTVMADIICRVTFGNRFDSSHPDFPNFMAANRVSFEDTELNEASSFYDFFPYAQYLPVKAYKEYEKLTEQIYSVLYKQLKEAEVVFDPSEPVEDLTCALIKARNDAEEQNSGEQAEQLSEDMILNTMSDMFTAGYETTSVTLLWVIAFLANYPEYQTEIQHELDQVVGWDRFPCLDDRPRLPLVQAAIMEAQRLGNTADCTMPHYTLTDTTLCGYRVPKGTVVYANLEAVHLDPMCWEDPNSYKPSRFIDADGQLISNHGNWFPFGAGRRVCTGEALAKAELFLLVSMMMQSCSFAPVKETKPPSLKGVVRFTKAPVPYTIRAVKRQ